MPHHLIYWIDDLGFFPIVQRTWSHPFLAYFAFCGREEVNWTWVDLEDPFLLYRWREGRRLALRTNVCPKASARLMVRSYTMKVEIGLLQLILRLTSALAVLMTQSQPLERRWVTSARTLLLVALLCQSQLLLEENMRGTETSEICHRVSLLDMNNVLWFSLPGRAWSVEWG